MSIPQYNFEMFMPPESPPSAASQSLLRVPPPIDKSLGKLDSGKEALGEGGKRLARAFSAIGELTEEEAGAPDQPTGGNRSCISIFPPWLRVELVASACKACMFRTDSYELGSG